MYACSGDTVTLAWKYTLGSGDTLSNIQWYRQRCTKGTVDTHVNGTFDGGEGNAGIVLHEVQQSDSGNYSLVVHVHDASRMHTTLTRSVYLQIDGKCHEYS